MSTRPPDHPLGGIELRAAFVTAAATLRRDALAIDAINVYPVPDGDTGSNMAATMQEAVEAALLLGESPSTSEVLRAITRGALYGARGNSGVILSQALRGLAAGVGDASRLDAERLAAGLDAAATSAYQAVARPVEGTMLTVLRAAATTAVAATRELPGRGAGSPCLTVLGAALHGALDAEANTINQLPALKEAGVPDSGGEGVCSLLRGLVAGLTGTPAPLTDLPALSLAASPGHQAEEFGFCTEFILEAADAPLDPDRVRRLLAEGQGTSLVVVGDSEAVHVHVHVPQVEPLLDLARSLGGVRRLKVDDMSAQHERFGEEGSGATARIGLLALSPGPGFDTVFEGLGARVVRLDETAKLAAGEIASAADRLRRPDVIILANHRDLVMAAQQAVELTACTLHVVPSTSLPQGIAAALACSPEASTAENVTRMNASLATVHSVEVTNAASDRHVAGLDVRQGQPIVFVDGRLVASASSIGEALIEGLREGRAAFASLVTVYVGATVNDSEGDRQLVARAFPAVEAEWVDGGQFLYPYIASIE